MMSSASSTEAAGGSPAEAGSHRTAAQSLQPWQFFVLAALVCATVATFLLRVQGIAGSVLLTALMGGAALVGAMGLRMVRPLFVPPDERAAVVSDRVRQTLERDKLLVLRAIKELEFDHAMGKLSAGDFQEMSGRLRARAARLIQQIDQSAGYRERIERDAAKIAESLARKGESARPVAESDRVCAACATSNDTDARFCKNCGSRL
jgi:hypothetical protein